MPQYYCHRCMISNSLVIPASPSSLAGTQYQLSKFIKHTAPSASSSRTHSVFNDPTYQAYSTYVVNTAASGFLEIDDWNRENLIWFAGSQTGVMYQNGSFVAPADGIKVVLPESDPMIHAFPIASSPLRSVVCDTCGRPIPFG